MTQHLQEAYELEHLARARLQALRLCPYLAAAITSLTFYRADGIATFAVDARLRVFVDPAVLCEWSVSQTAGALIHEVNHVLRGHFARARGSKEIWNVASDLEINDDLARARIELPIGALLPITLGLPDSQTAEFYAAALQRNSDPDIAHFGGKNGGKDVVRNHSAPRGFGECRCGSGATGVRDAFETVDEPSGVSETRLCRIRQLVAEEVLSSAVGDIPAGLRRWAEGFARPITWRTHLHTALRKAVRTQSGQVDHEWSRPNRRHRGRVLLPRLVGRVVDVAYIVDTSGSMKQSDLDLALGEILGLRRQSIVGDIHVISCDTVAQYHGLVTRSGIREFALQGGGGTTLQAALSLLDEEGLRCAIVVFITDGHNAWSSSRPRGTNGTKFIAVTPTRAPSAPDWIEQIQLSSWKSGR